MTCTTFNLNLCTIPKFNTWYQFSIVELPPARKPKKNARRNGGRFGSPEGTEEDYWEITSLVL